MNDPLFSLKVRTLTINNGDIWQLQEGGVTTIITPFGNTCIAMTHNQVTFNYTVPYTNTILLLFNFTFYNYI